MPDAAPPADPNSTPSTSVPPEAPLNIVICSDGTWQKGGQSTPTNVWRTYVAVQPQNQIKFHDDGVGAGGIKPHRVIAGAFGFGISRNIQELIESLIKAYKPGARIYLFGFSRGAFTVRVLADLVCQLGIPRAEGKSPEEISKLARALLNYYKNLKNGYTDLSKDAMPRKPPRRSRSAATENTNEAFIREVQDKLETYPTAECEEDGKFLIHFVGCWDTVEAVGLPTDFLKKLAIKFLFPLRFDNQFPSPKIKQLCHALCLDDERHTFHPLLWQTPPQGLDPEQTLEQVWFMGGHSHVGGGYAKDQLAMEPLHWMLSKAEEAGLRLNEELRDHFQAHAYRHGEMHPSRPWNAKFYRYQPRLLSKAYTNKNRTLGQQADDCRVHESVLERIELGTDSYAPTAIDLDFQVVTTAEPSNVENKHLPSEYRNNILKANGYVAWGNRLYWLCVLAWIVLAVGCWWGNSALGGPKITKAQPLIEVEQNILRSVLHSIYSAEYFALDLVEAFLPAIIGDSFIAWLKNLPGALTLFLAFYALCLWAGKYLRQRIHRAALAAWHESGIIEQKKAEPDGDDVMVPRSLDVGLITLSVSIAAGFMLAAWLGWKPYHAHARIDSSHHPTIVLDRGMPSHRVDFATQEAMFPTGVAVEAGATYEVRVQTISDWDDGGNGKMLAKSAEGFEDFPIHRFYRNLRVGPREWNSCMFALCASIDDGTPIKIGQAHQWTATQSGHLFLFVNDVAGFYHNNQGTAEILITRVFPSDDNGPTAD